ncbi:hypothetical protein ACFPM1_03780 [Halorubrum rubrum]|uniref:DUF7344 domain-containing protein n=1 Tax=Halorubrum rubrum TaxID=1126240 RepID=A0ABD5QYX9_9EURY|nr:hypothetical protein [Halorubrum rubrum]
MDQISSERDDVLDGDPGEPADPVAAENDVVADDRDAADDGGGESDHIPTDEVFALLSNGRRRHVLRFLRRNGGEIKLRELATVIAAEENGVEPVEVTYTQRKRLYTSLYQSHLPRMERSGVIEYDRNSGLVTLAAAAGDFDAYLEVVGENEFTWSEFYLGLTGLFAVVTLAYATGTPPFATLGPAAVMTAMTVLLLVAAVAHVRYTRGRQL